MTRMLEFIDSESGLSGSVFGGQDSFAQLCMWSSFIGFPLGISFLL